MKQQWQKIALKIDALSLRERAMVFVAATALLLMVINSTLLNPQLLKQKLTSENIRQEQEQIAAIQTEIQQKVSGQKADPDAVNRSRIQELKQQSEQLHGQLMDMQKGLVAPEKMAGLLEDILKRNGGLQVLSLRTLPVSDLTDTKTAANVAGPTGAASLPGKEKIETPSSSGVIYKHGVEIVVQGSYPDIMHAMAAMESMPWQLFWSKATLNADEYPRATLTLTLYTLSLDKKWLNI